MNSVARAFHIACMMAGPSFLVSGFYLNDLPLKIIGGLIALSYVGGQIYRATIESDADQFPVIGTSIVSGAATYAIFEHILT